MSLLRRRNFSPHLSLTKELLLPFFVQTPRRCFAYTKSKPIPLLESDDEKNCFNAFRHVFGDLGADGPDWQAVARMEPERDDEDFE
jgi:hypothetical protein